MGVIVFGFVESIPLEQLVVVGWVMGQFDGGRVLEAVDENSLPLMSRIGILSWPPQHLHSSPFDPLASGVQEGASDLIILHGVEEAKETDLCAMIIVEAAVDSCGDAPQQIAVSPGKEVRHLCMSVIRVSRCEQPW